MQLIIYLFIAFVVSRIDYLVSEELAESALYEKNYLEGEKHAKRAIMILEKLRE